MVCARQYRFSSQFYKREQYILRLFFRKFHKDWQILINYIFLITGSPSTL